MRSALRLGCAAMVLCCTTAALPQAAAPAETTQHRDALRLVETWLEAQAAYERVPALSAGIVIGQDLVWRRAWGQADHARRVPASSNTIYSICSISKLFTAVAVMQLWEQGRLSLDDDIAQLLPGFALQRSDPDSGPISVRGLLTHSSGLPREGDFGYWNPPDFKFPSRAELLQGLAGQRTYARAADRQQYSNLGLALLGEIVATVSGMPYDSYVQTHILAPLRLADTRTSLPRPLWGQQLAQGHGALQRDGTRAPLPWFDAAALAPAAGYSSTVEDLARFAAWQFRLRKNGGTELLRVATLREMQRVQWTDPDGKNSWGLGFWVGRDGGTLVAGHSGVCPGYLSAVYTALNEEVAVIALANANDNRSMNRYANPMRRLMLKGLKLPVAPAAGPALEDYAGRYDGQPFDSEVVILPWGKDLAKLELPTTDPTGAMTLLRHVAGDSFRELREDGSLGSETSFLRNAAGQVTAAREWNQVLPRLRAPLPARQP